MQYKGAAQVPPGKTGFFTGALSDLLSGALEVAVFECPGCGILQSRESESA